MTVLFLINNPAPYRVEFFNELGKLCELTVLFEETRASYRDESWNNANNLHYDALFLSPKKILRKVICFDVIDYLKKHDFDIVVVGGYSTLTGMLAIEYLRFKKIPFCLNCDGGIIKNDNVIKYQIKKLFISKASYWLSSGKASTEYFVHYGANPAYIYQYPFTSLLQKDILPNVPSAAETQTLRNQLGITEEKMVLSIGQFIYRKGYDVLLKACAALDHAIGVYIVGGEPTEEYISMKETLQLENVHFVGFKTKESLQEYYKAADLFVLPTREDIWGLVINEAMACGLPIITTDKCVAGLELVENDVNGWLVPANNEKLLAGKINDVLSDKEQYKKMRESALRKIGTYTIENMAEVHFEIFEKIMKGE